QNLSGNILYPIIHLKGHDIEVAFTHGTQYGEEYYSFVNGQHTTQGGTHQGAFREAVVKTIREFYKKEFEAVDVRTSIVAAISVKVQEPVFESQTKTKLGSQVIAPDGMSIRAFINDFVKEALDNYLHKNQETAELLLQKIVQSEKERKELSGIRKLARERAKKASLHNKKLRDCRIHFNSNDERSLDTTLFICEGDSASGSITKTRDVNTQAVFSLKGKPLNCFGLTKKIVYENEEFNLLQSALNIEDGMDDLRYNNIVLATDADVDGMHIRLLLITFFLQFFPDLVKNGHLYILQTPLFRVRNKKETIYCYSDEERINAIQKLGPKPEITRFKGLGEISPDEFKNFIGKDIRLDPVIITKAVMLEEMLQFYMGKNTPERQDFIIDHLKIEKDLVTTPA
ncbi:MAG: toprim domain-containing protein, partial [Bacteroidota bacterium]